MGRTPIWVHVHGDLAEVEFYDGEIVQDVHVCDHSSSDEHRPHYLASVESVPRQGAAAESQESFDLNEVTWEAINGDDIEGVIVFPKPRPELKNDKYIVFKADEWANIVKHSAAAILNGAQLGEVPRPLEDAVVIRHQDVFAGPGLYAYANAIQTAIDLVETLPGDAAHLQRWEGLGDLRDFFFDMAQQATRHPNKKIPD